MAHLIINLTTLEDLHKLISRFLFTCCHLLKVSVFDSIVQGGDSVWEGLRVYDGKIFKLEEHLDRSVKRGALTKY